VVVEKRVPLNRHHIIISGGEKDPLILHEKDPLNQKDPLILQNISANNTVRDGGGVGVGHGNKVILEPLGGMKSKE